MFTGLIESVCTVRSLVAGGRDCCLQVDLGSLAADDRIGSSFAINGVCLTATRYQATLEPESITLPWIRVPPGTQRSKH